MSSPKPGGPFYRDDSSEAGLRFTCTRCSACCRFDSGYVWLSQEDIQRLANELGLSRSQTIERFCTTVTISGIKRLSLSEQENMDCIFWTGGACSVYEGRPLQCRSFPFWAPFLDTREDWNELETSCPGVNIGELHDADEVESWLRLRRLEPPIDADSSDEGSFT